MFWPLPVLLPLSCSGTGDGAKMKPATSWPGTETWRSYLTPTGMLDEYFQAPTLMK